MLRKVEFLTADQIGIKREEYDALLLVLSALEDGSISRAEFSMNCWNIRKNVYGEWNTGWEIAHPFCRTVACIGGWGEVLGNIEFDGTSKPLDGLFSPMGVEWKYITTEQAALALRNFFTTGVPDWRNVVNLGI